MKLEVGKKYWDSHDKDEATEWIVFAAHPTKSDRLIAYSIENNDLAEFGLDGNHISGGWEEMDLVKEAVDTVYVEATSNGLSKRFYRDEDDAKANFGANAIVVGIDEPKALQLGIYEG